jgi:hypothetical protein
MTKLDELHLSLGNPTSLEGTHLKTLKLDVNPHSEPLVERIIPEKWFCIVSTSSVYQDYEYRAIETFINFEWSERVEDPRSELLCAHSSAEHDHHDHSFPSTGSTIPGEHHYQIPYLLERSFNSQNLKIFDFVVGRKAMRWARKQADFLNVLIQSSIEAIEENFQDVVESKSIQWVQGIDFKMPPEKIVILSESKPTPHASSPLMPYLQRKINNLFGCDMIDRSNTAMTNQQREMLRLKTLPSMNSSLSPFNFVETLFEESYHDILKIHIPKLTMRQNERFVTILVHWPSHASLIKWNVIRISIENNDNDVDPTTSLNGDFHRFAVEASCMDDQTFQSYSFHVVLFSQIDIEQCYATSSSNSFIIVCPKFGNFSFWPLFVLHPSLTS